MARIITFGELMLRLQPFNYERFVQAQSVEFTFGGGEANVSVSLANYGMDAAFKLGLEVLKFFPAEQSGGLAKIKAMAAPFPMFKVMPTGGVNLKNLGEYAACPIIAACGGSYMCPDKLIEAGAWDEITELCKKSVEIVKEARK